MNLLLEFNRNDLSDARDKLLQDIETIKSGHSLEMGQLQTRWMTAIEECSELIQKCRNMQLNGTLTKKGKWIIKKTRKRMENNLSYLQKYESLLPNYNRNFPNKKLQTFKERTGKVLIENKTKYFNY